MIVRLNAAVSHIQKYSQHSSVTFTSIFCDVESMGYTWEDDKLCFR